MKRYEWSSWTDADSAHRRAAGRRRYNAMRQRRAEERRAAMAEVLQRMGPWAWVYARGLAPALARAFGVHRTTAWRDIQRLLYPPRECIFSNSDGEELFTVARECQGGPVVSVTDPDGNEIRGASRRQILRWLPRYLG